VTVPGLSASGGAADDHSTLVSVLAPPTSRQNLMAALHASIPKAPGPENAPQAARLTTAPDPRLAGRYVYALAIQMPNVSSFSGSWIVWFAEHQPAPGAPPGDVRPPLATHKVDPKYIPAAADEKVEGTVRLAAVIRRTGRVDSVELVRHLDARLDRSAAEALAKWEFEPATRNGQPIDIDAVFEIPFRLAPKPK
jgi:TonB family protein